MHAVGKNYALDQKMMAPFLMASTSSITMQCLGKIVPREPAVGSKIWCSYVFFFGCHARRPGRCSFEGNIVLSLNK